MKNSVWNREALNRFQSCLICEERSPRTIEKYMRDAEAFCRFLPRDKQLCKEQVIAYKARLAQSYKASSANSMLVAVNRFLAFLGRQDCRVKLFKIQRSNFRQAEKELSKEEYRRLLKVARSKKNERLYLLMQTLCGAGLRVSELRFVTVECLQTGRVRVACKGKQRVALLPRALCRKLERYVRERRLYTGPVFVTAGGAPLDRSHIWADMKRLCTQAKVARAKVFPHNLRHLFARTYYEASKDLLRLADLLGHSSINTTRIYTLSDGSQEFQRIEQLRLIQ